MTTKKVINIEEEDEKTEEKQQKSSFWPILRGTHKRGSKRKRLVGIQKDREEENQREVI